jgi:hypothetical protein
MEESMAKQFTDKAIAAAKPKKTRYYLREGRGFVLQVLPTGAKAFVYLYELNKSKGYLLLGQYPTMSLADARIAYNEAYKLVKKGVDPREQRKVVAKERAMAAMEAAQEAEAAARAAAN